MAANEHLNHEQLRMFVPAKELMTYTAGHTEGSNEDYLPLSESPGVYHKMLSESKSGSAHDTWDSKKKGKDSLYDSIKKDGVKSPVELRVFKRQWSQPVGETVTQINNGNHRVVAANDINPDMEVPVRYS
jgi:hypothetical protein